ncbi:hypothetical protein F4678DRAFT_429897, partial [Xylaria arbuscula]
MSMPLSLLLQFGLHIPGCCQVCEGKPDLQSHKLLTFYKRYECGDLIPWPMLYTNSSPRKIFITAVKYYQNLSVRVYLHLGKIPSGLGKLAVRLSLRRRWTAYL